MSYQDNTAASVPATSNNDDDILKDLDLSEATVVATSEPCEPEPKSETVADTKSHSGNVVKFKGGKKTTPDDDKQFAPVATRIRERTQKGVLMLVENGRDLIAVKEKMGHGKFGTWLKREFGWTERTAQNYMNATKAHEEFITQGCKPEAIALLPPTMLYNFDRLTDEAKEACLKMIKSGDISRAIKEAKAAKKSKGAASASSANTGDKVSASPLAAGNTDAQELAELITGALSHAVRDKIANHAGFAAPGFAKLLQKEIIDSFGDGLRAKAA